MTIEDTLFCECGHSFYDHDLSEQGSAVGECLVGGCECSEYRQWPVDVALHTWQQPERHRAAGQATKAGQP